MVLPPISVTDLRYLREDASLESERLIVSEWCKDLIDVHGIDCTYIRKHSTFYDSPSGTCDYIYGEDSTALFNLSASMVVYVEVLSDDFLTNHLGINSAMDVNCYFHVETFNQKFRDQLGITTGSVMTSVMTGGLTGFTGYISGQFGDVNVSGVTSASIDLSGVSGSISQAYSGSDIIAYTPVNPNLKYFAVYPYPHATTGAMSGSYSGFVDVSGNGWLSGVSSGYFNYFAPPAVSHGPGWETNIPPNVGDIVRIQFTRSNPEEFEISQVQNRILTPDGLNPLLQLVVWKCNATRREPSRELMTDGTMPQEPLTTDKTELNGTMTAISDAIFDYSTQAVDSVDGVDSDKVYGTF